MKLFSQRLIALRKERDMTQADLAKAIRKTRSTVSGYETEGKEPDYEMLCTLAKFFGVSVDYLLGVEDCRTHSDVVFVNDSVNFKKHYDALPSSLRQKVAKIYDSFYLLLNRDMVNTNEERLQIYGELFELLQDSRARIKNEIGGCGGKVTDPLLLSDLIAMQNNLKNGVAALLDKLMQADINTAFNTENDDLSLSEQETT